ncbi:MAG: aminoglycoside phosphotransferase family protein [Syntrophobacteraceae bacterium]
MIKKLSTRGMAPDYLRAAAEQFDSADRMAEIRKFGAGNINDTYLVSTTSKRENYFILQRINRRVFSTPELIMQNLRAISEHVSESLRRNPPAGRRWEMPRLLLTACSQDHWIDPDGCFWRALSFIENSKSFDSVIDLDHAVEVGYAIGLFHTLVSDLPANRLRDTLEGFHITPIYLGRYLEVLEKHRIPASADAAFCMDFIDRRKEFAPVLEKAKAEGRLLLRIIHGDPKVSNVMIDTGTGLAVSIVDLDTVKPGLVHYDIGDSLRSCCNPLGEDPGKPDEVRFEPELCRALLRGYVSVAKGFLTQNDFEFIYDSIRLIAYELGVRFFTDYLEGDVYFKVKDRRQNLRRALVQFHLAESIESQAQALRAIIREAVSSEK